MPTRISTNDVAVRERPSYWNYLVSSVLGRLNTIPQRAGRFTGSIAYSHLSSIPIAQVQSTQLRVQRLEKYIDSPDEDFYKINFQLKGRATLTQNGRTAQLAPGQWVIYDNTHPYELHFHDDYQQLLFLVPRAQLLQRFAAIDLQMANVFSSQSGMGRLLFNFASNALSESSVISAESQTHTAQMMLDMLILGLVDATQTNPSLPTATRFVQITQFIGSHLHDRELSAETLAQRLHLSKRYIQQIFANNDTTVNRYIWQQRIKRCQQDLADPRLATSSIKDIAFGWGFSSSAHFSRLFKQTVGQTPKAYRQQALNALSQ